MSVLVATLLTALVLTAELLALSSEIKGVIFGLALSVAIAFAASLAKLTRLFIRFAEAWGRQRIVRWAKREGIDPDEILDD